MIADSSIPDGVWRDARQLAVLGMGVALPGPPLETSALLDKIADQCGVDVRRRGSAIAHRLGIQTRHICRDFASRQEPPRRGHSNAELAARALATALTQSALSVNELSYLISHTATPGDAIPPNVAHVAEIAGYHGPYLELRQACTGFANALIVAQGLLAQPTTRAVAIVGSETGSVYLDPARAEHAREQLVNLVQMGDAAAAIVLTRAKSGHAHISRVFFGQIGYSRPASLRLRAGGSLHVGIATAEFEHDFDAVRQHGVELFEAGITAARTLGVDAASVDYVVPHQVNGRLAEFLAPRLGLRPKQVFVNADRVGNTGSAAIWVALHALQGALRGGERALILGAEATKHMYGGFCYDHA